MSYSLFLLTSSAVTGAFAAYLAFLGVARPSFLFTMRRRRDNWSRYVLWSPIKNADSRYSVMNLVMSMAAAPSLSSLVRGCNGGDAAHVEGHQLASCPPVLPSQSESQVTARP